MSSNASSRRAAAGGVDVGATLGATLGAELVSASVDSVDPDDSDAISGYVIANVISPQSIETRPVESGKGVVSGQLRTEKPCTLRLEARLSAMSKAKISRLA